MIHILAFKKNSEKEFDVFGRMNQGPHSHSILVLTEKVQV